jgi:hypothetical protein
MQVYGQQLQPILRTLIDRGGLPNINPDGGFFERAIARAQLSRWPAARAAAPPSPPPRSAP